jgi:hypothetical protein
VCQRISILRNSIRKGRWMEVELAAGRRSGLGQLASPMPRAKPRPQFLYSLELYRLMVWDNLSMAMGCFFQDSHICSTMVLCILVQCLVIV